MSEITYDELKGYKYRLRGDRFFKTSCPNVECNKYLAIKNGILWIKAGYCWDGNSGPTPDTAKTMIPSLVHDAYYQMMREECIDRDDWREYADGMYRQLCIEAGMWQAVAECYYWAVRKFGKKKTQPGSDKRGKAFQVKSANKKTVKRQIPCLLLAVIGCLSAGCMFVHVPGKGTVVSLFKNIDADEIYIEKDPNGVVWFVKYQSDAKNARLKVNPLTRTIEAVVEDKPTE